MSHSANWFEAARHGDLVCGICGAKSAELSIGAWVTPGELKFEEFIGDSHHEVAMGPVTYCCNCDEYNVPLVTEEQYEQSLFDRAFVV